MSQTVDQLRSRVASLEKILEEHLGVTPNEYRADVVRGDGIRMRPVMSETAWDRTERTQGADLDWDDAHEFNRLGIPYPNRNGDLNCYSYDGPSHLLEPIRNHLKMLHTEITERGFSVVPMEYHHVIKSVVADAISDTVNDVGTMARIIDDHRDDMWGIHLNLWNTQVTNMVATDELATANSQETRDDLNELLATTAGKCKGLPDKTNAVEAAIRGTVEIFENASVTGMISNMVGMTQLLESTWATSVNS